VKSTDSPVARRQQLQSFDACYTALSSGHLERVRCDTVLASRKRITYAKVGIRDVRSVLDIVTRRFGYSSTLFVLAKTDILHDEHGQPPKKRINRGTKVLQARLVQICAARRDNDKTIAETLNVAAHGLALYVLRDSLGTVSHPVIDIRINMTTVRFARQTYS